ncbi:MAG: hypothetical protein Q4E88_02910 [Coriobacteriia bacterium]|nr:hypothetical protein [Coriobacteriia bacterium]
MPHYRLSEWHLDDKGFWRDSEGYFVVAYTLTAEIGTVIEISDGCYGRVYDHCESPGVVDIYVGW